MHWSVFAALAAMVSISFVAVAADRVYVNGTVLTMDERGSVSEALVVDRGRVVATGTSAAMRRLAGKTAEVVDLKGRTMAPGFYAAHDHFPAWGTLRLTYADLNSPPIGSIETIGQLQKALRVREKLLKPGEWLTGSGYDDTLLAEKRHPTREDLDAVSSTRPVFVVHVSGHFGVANSVALRMAGITRDSAQPAGGVIRKRADGEPDGVIEESVALVMRLLPVPDEAQRLEAIRLANAHYLARGVTTSVVTGTDLQTAKDFQKARAAGALDLRMKVMLRAGAEVPEKAAGDLNIVKITQDGSIQGYTGYLTKPYFVDRPGHAGERGYPARSRGALIELVKMYHRGGYQIAIHANGDAAIDDVLAAYEAAQKDFPRTDPRHRIEHAQMAREDQLDRMKALGVTPSFFVGHVYYWGDRHRDIFLGPERAARISPLAAAERRGLRFTVHDDTPVTPVNPLMLVWDAVNRTTKRGQVLGAEQRISVLQALRAVTSDAAWQNHEEANKGSIEAGKWADFVVLEKNPLKVAAAEIREIQVMETIIQGKRVWQSK